MARCRLQVLLVAALIAWAGVVLWLYSSVHSDLTTLRYFGKVYLTQPDKQAVAVTRFNIESIVRATNCTCSDERIPRILHHIFLDGEAAYDAETQHPDPAFRRSWRESCIVHHPYWQHRFWDLDTAEQFLEERYPWFLPIFRGYKRTVAKSDSLRIFLMHAFGGLYVDLDVECFRNGDDMLKGYDIVLQGTAPEEGVTNAVMASAPGHPFWGKAMKALVTNSQLEDDHPINQTGPGIIANLLRLMVPNLPKGKHVNFREHLVGVIPAVAGTKIRVYPLGYHRYSGSWNGYTGRWIVPKMDEYFKEAVSHPDGGQAAQVTTRKGLQPQRH
ncbi:hypothetical protein WJX72_008031 [[Myrmecia] bisecta]|uniref:Uncharacterized protein n=1 Tax=[Myrmecia] bisecta TaxID=41462 RepID=A0AAW1QRK5_9CHLO